MVGRTHGHDPIASHDDVFQVTVRGLEERHEGQVKAAGAERREMIERRRLPEVQLDLRIVPLEVSEDPDQVEPRDHDLCHANGELTAAQPLHRLDRLAAGARGCQRPTRLRQQGLTGRGQRDASGAAVEERRSKFALEEPDRRRQAGLHDPDPFGGTREMPLVRHGHEVLQLPKFHGGHLHSC